MLHQALFIFGVLWLGISNANTLQGSIDVNRLQNILQEGIKSKDVTSLYYAIKGLTELKATLPDLCQDIKNVKYDANSIEHIFYLTNAAALTGCQNSLTPEVLKLPVRILDKKDATIPELYHAVYSMKALGKGTVYDKEDSLKNLIQLLKKDDSPANYGYVFSLCEHIGCESWTVSHAEGALAAADETDARALSFDGGLPVTAMLLTTIIRAFAKEKKASPLSERQKLQFAEYLVWRRSVGGPRGAALLLQAAHALADDKSTPISIVFKGKKYVTSESDSVEFSITDLIGRPVRGLKPEEVIAQSGTRLADDVVVLSKQVLTQKPNEPTTYVLNLSKIKAQYGMYKIALSAGGKTTNLNVAVLGEIQVTSIELGIGDVDGTTSPKISTINYPNKPTEKLQADHLQKVSLKWSVRDKFGASVSVQQAFVQAAAGDREAIFIAEHDNTKAYKVDLNVGAIAKHLDYVSGTYSLTVYLGDSAVSNPIAWHVADIAFNFGKEASPDEAVVRGPLPEVRHEFRAAEARPPRGVSDVFAAGAAAPLALLLVLWFRLRPPLRPAPAIAAFAFHVSLAGFLALYGVLWLKLTMFETVRYLIPLALFTFLSGHRLLRKLANEKLNRQLNS